MSNKFCTNCGNPLGEDLAFCTNCGTPTNNDNDQGASDPAPQVPTEPVPIVAAAEPHAPVLEPGSWTVNNATEADTGYMPGDAPVAEPKPKQKSKMSTNSIVAIIIAAAVVIIAAVIIVFMLTGGFTQRSEVVLDDVEVEESAQKSELESPSPSDDQGESQENNASANTAHDIGKITLKGSQASSELPTDSKNPYTYTAYMASDGDIATAWVENAPGNGEGESITLYLFNGYTVTGAYFYNGYQKTEKLYYENARPRTVNVYADGSLIDTITLKDAGCTIQKIDFKTPTMATEIRFEITSVYPGTKFEDCAISEIELLGYMG